MGDELIDMHNRIGVANRFPVNRYPQFFLFSLCRADIK